MNSSKLKTARQNKGLTQKQLGEMTGLNWRTLQHYEQGSRDLNGAAAIIVYRLAEALDVKVEDLLELDRE